MSSTSGILPDDTSLEKESPLLHSISKETPFSVPDNYFESLPSELVEKCQENVEPKNWGEGFLAGLLAYKWKLLGGIGCLALLCFFMLQINTRPVSYEAMAKNIPDSLIVEHLDKNIADISVTTLEDLQEPENNNGTASDSTNTDQEIVTYLMNTNVNVSDIVNEP
jgi:hypothetical protein